MNCKFCTLFTSPHDILVIRETESAVAFLPKDMEVFGHTLIAPRGHYETIYDIPDEILMGTLELLKAVSVHYNTVFRTSGCNILHASGASAQQSIMHFHWHLFPRMANDGLDTWPNLKGCTIDRKKFYDEARM